MVDALGKGLMRKLITLLLGVSVIPVLIIGVLGFQFGKQALHDQIIESYTAISEGREATIIQFLHEKRVLVESMAADGIIEDGVQQFAVKRENSALSVKLGEYISNEKMSIDKSVIGILILSLDGKVIAATDRLELGRDYGRDPSFLHGMKGAYIADISRASGSEQTFFTVSSPIADLHDDRKLLGVIMSRISTKDLNAIATNREGMGETGEVYIVNSDSYMVTDSRFISDAVLKQKVDSEPVRLSQGQNKMMAGIYTDYRGEQVVGASMGDDLNERYGLGWTILVEISEDEAFQKISDLAKLIWMVSGIIVIAVLILAVYFGRSLSRPISRVAEDLAATSTQMATTVEEHDRTASSQASAVNETSTTMVELGTSAQRVEEQADAAMTGASDATALAEEGGKNVHEMLDAMIGMKEKVAATAQQILSLSEKTAQIGSITSLVRELANQTNLLALNAAVEAARAGEHGKGFAVVAAEIRKLADQSKKSAERINSLVEDIQTASNSTVMVVDESTKMVDQSLVLANNTAGGFEGVVHATGGAFESLQQIALNVKQQAAAINQVVHAMQGINSGAKETAAGITQSKVGIVNLKDAAQKLRDLVGHADAS